MNNMTDRRKEPLAVCIARAKEPDLLDMKHVESEEYTITTS